MKHIENVNTIEVVNLVKDYGHNRGVLIYHLKLTVEIALAFLVLMELEKVQPLDTLWDFLNQIVGSA